MTIRNICNALFGSVLSSTAFSVHSNFTIQRALMHRPSALHRMRLECTNLAFSQISDFSFRCLINVFNHQKPCTITLRTKWRSVLFFPRIGGAIRHSAVVVSTRKCSFSTEQSLRLYSGRVRDRPCEIERHKLVLEMLRWLYANRMGITSFTNIVLPLLKLYQMTPALFERKHVFCWTPGVAIKVKMVQFAALRKPSISV